MKNIIYHIFVLLLFFVFALIFTYPLITVFTTKLIGEGTDSFQFLFNQNVAYLNLRNLQFPFQYSYLLRYPVGFDFSIGFDSVFFTLLGSFLRFLLNPISTYNLSIILSFTISCYFSYLLFYQLIKSRLVSILGALMYGFSFYSLARGAGHPNLMIIGGFPLFFYALIRLKTNQRLFDFMLLPLSALFIICSSQVYGLMLIIFLIFNIFLIPLFLKKELDFYLDIFKKNFNKLFIASFVCLIIFLIFFTPTLKSLIQGRYENADRNIIAKDNSISIKEYILPNPFIQTSISKIVNSGTLKSIENVAFVGFVELFLFLAFLFFTKKGNYKSYIIVNIIIFFLLSLGIQNPDLHIPLPLILFYKYFPFEYIPETTRYFVIFYLFICIGIVLLLKQIANNKLLILMFFILLTLERITPNYYISSVPQNSFGDKVAIQPGNGVLDLPINFYEPVYDYLPILYGKNVISGNFHWSVDSLFTRSFVNDNPELSRFLCDTQDSLLVGANFKNKEFITSEEKLNEKLKLLMLNNDIRTIVLHKDDPFKLYDYQNCNNVWLRINTLLTDTLTIKPTGLKSEIIEQKWPISRVNIKMLFPEEGVLTINKIEIYTSEPVILIASLSEKVITIKQNESIKIPRNSILVIKSDSIFNKGYVKINYSFEAKSVGVPEISVQKSLIEIKKIYSDDYTEVYSLTQ